MCLSLILPIFSLCILLILFSFCVPTLLCLSPSYVSFFCDFFCCCFPFSQLQCSLVYLPFFSCQNLYLSLSPCHIPNGENTSYPCIPFPRKYLCRKTIKQRLLCYCLPETYPFLLKCGKSTSGHKVYQI